MSIRFERKVKLPTEYGAFRLQMYYSEKDRERHLALVLGHPEKEPAALVRLHSECLTGDVFGSLRCDCGSQLRESMRMIAAAGQGVVLYMRQEGRGIGLAHKMHAYELQESGLDTVEANTKLGFEADLRDYESGADILKNLGILRVSLITNNPGKIAGLQQHGIEVVERVPLVIEGTAENLKYMRTKKEKMGHLL